MLLKLILSHIIGSTYCYQVWDTVNEYFHLQTKTHALHLCTDLHCVSVNGKTMREFLTHIKTILDKLPGVGNPVLLEEHVDAILEVYQ